MQQQQPTTSRIASSLYSPSSSASLLYDSHIYDQIASVAPTTTLALAPQSQAPTPVVVNSQTPNQIAQITQIAKQTTTLNPATLFSQNPFVAPSKWEQHQQQQQLIQTPLLASNNQNTNSAFVPANATSFVTSASQHVLGTTARQHQHAAARFQSTLGANVPSAAARFQHQNNANQVFTSQQQQHQQLQSSSSICSSLSNPSSSLTYARHPAHQTSHTHAHAHLTTSRHHNHNQHQQQHQMHRNHNLHPADFLPGAYSNNSSAYNDAYSDALAARVGIVDGGLASVLRSSHVNNFDANKLHAINCDTAASGSRHNGCHERKLRAKQATFVFHCNKAVQQLKHYANRHQTSLNLIALLLLVACGLTAIIKLTSLSSQSKQHLNSQQHHQSSLTHQAPIISSAHSPPATNTHLQAQHQNPNLNTASQAKISVQQASLPASPQYPQQTFEEPKAVVSQQQQQLHQQQQPDLDSAFQINNNNNNRDGLRSKYVIGDFVIVSLTPLVALSSQAMGAELSKSLDQVLSKSDLHRFYVRCEITKLSASNLPLGVLVSFRLILSESISYAAQLFGDKLLSSLQSSNDALAGNANFIVDTRTIRLNAVPDKDISSGIVQGFEFEPLAPSTVEQVNVAPEPQNKDNNNNNNVQWTDWSPWSSCFDKNGLCDAQRLHSRVRHCVSRVTSDELPEAMCKQRFGTSDLSLEVSDCATTCSSSAPLAGASVAAQTIMSSQAINQASGNSLAMQPAAVADTPLASLSPAPVAKAIVGEQSSTPATPQPAPNPFVLPSTSASTSTLASTLASSTSTLTLTSTLALASKTNTNSSQTIAADLNAAAPSDQQTSMDKTTTGCKQCSANEVCVLPIKFKVPAPFCLRVKDVSDTSGCGGWCNGPNELCQAMGAASYGQNAFKCVHDSECLPEEWRCANSACIPLSKRCDGHSNCFDNSDELDCPAAPSLAGAPPTVRKLM